MSHFARSAIWVLWKKSGFVRSVISNIYGRQDTYSWGSPSFSLKKAILAAEDLLANAYEVAAQVLRANVRDLAHDGVCVVLTTHDAGGVTGRDLALARFMDDAAR